MDEIATYHIDKCHSAFRKLLDHMFESNFTGYDPYDGLTTSYEFLKANNYSRLGLIYLNKFSPLNIRKILRIRESQQLMTLGTVANALFYLNSLDDRELSFIHSLYNKLKEETLYPKYGFHCWDARKFPIQMQNKLIEKDIPSVVGNEIYGSFLINYYLETGDSEALPYLSSLTELLVNRFYCEKNGCSFFRYRINDTDESITHNASLKGMSLLIKASKIFGNNTRHVEIIEKVLKTTLKFQNENGSWNYTSFVNCHKGKKQIDFHQGFILDDILLFMIKYGFNKQYQDRYLRGLEFYSKKQFLVNGQGVYRYPRKWPADIHNQAQGIITFTRAARAGFGDHYFQLAHKISYWTINNMQDKEGFFYFLKYPWFTNKISYIRWSDANMAYALSVLLSGKNNQFN
jgi:hypothetical protein